jgi:hypothetical protein
VQLEAALVIARQVFFDSLPIEDICRAHLRYGKNEIETRRILSPRSSAALAGNLFGIFLKHQEAISEVLPELGVNPTTWLEKEARLPWRGGSHPRLDALVETSTAVVGIEVKWYEPFDDPDEPFDDQKAAKFSSVYNGNCWGDRMGPFENLRDELTSKWVPEHLNAVQLVKHAFGLRTRAKRLGKSSAVLLYVYAQPNVYVQPKSRRPGLDGTQIPDENRSRHACEIARFASEVSGSEVEFQSCTVAQIVEKMRKSTVKELRHHADMIASKYGSRLGN